MLEKREGDTKIQGPPEKSNRLKPSEGRGSIASVTISPFLLGGKWEGEGVATCRSPVTNQLYIVPCFGQVP